MKTALTLRTYADYLDGTRWFAPEYFEDITEAIRLYAPEAVLTPTKSGKHVRVSGIEPKTILWIARVLQNKARYNDAMRAWRKTKSISAEPKYIAKAQRAHDRLTVLFNR